MEDGHLMDERRRCRAMSKRTGLQCRRAPALGTTVCAMHGAKAPQVQRSARERLAELHDPALRRYARALESDDDRTALRAAGDVMKHSIDYVPPASAQASPAAVKFDRLSNDELELLSVLVDKLEGRDTRYDGQRLYRLTIAKTEERQPGSDVFSPVKIARLTVVPDPNARQTTGPLPAGQGDTDSNVGNTTVNAADIATD